jgi:hypothetical protein
MTPRPDWVEQGRLLLEEVRRAVADAPPATGDGPTATGDGPDATGRPSGDADPSDCRWCPICQFAAVLRGERPEVTAALADVLTATATALRAFAEDSDRPSGAATSTGEEPSGDPAPVVQRIEIA